MKKRRIEPSGLKLPTENSIPHSDLGDYSVLLFGEKKIGKTTLTACFPSSVHLMFEPGGKALSIKQVPVPRWEDAKEYLKLLRRDKTFKTVVVDTADIAYRAAARWVCERLGVDHPSDESYGKGWEACRDEFTLWINELLSIGKGVVFVSHSQDREIARRSGVKYHKILPTMSNQARDVLEPVVDIWVYYGYDGERRVLTITGDEHIGAGHRLTKQFKGVKTIDMGYSPEEGYRNFVDAFNNRYRKSVTIKRRTK